MEGDAERSPASDLSGLDRGGNAVDCIGHNQRHAFVCLRVPSWRSDDIGWRRDHAAEQCDGAAAGDRERRLGRRCLGRRLGCRCLGRRHHGRCLAGNDVLNGDVPSSWACTMPCDYQNCHSQTRSMGRTAARAAHLEGLELLHRVSTQPASPDLTICIANTRVGVQVAAVSSSIMSAPNKT